jgi:ADP-ribose diphosphatase
MSERKDAGKPEILSVRTAARSRLFHIEAVQLRFANGNEREFERVAGSAIPGAVVIVPLLDAANILLVREYAVGLERYELGLPMGRVHERESALEAANRELMEEISSAPPAGSWQRARSSGRQASTCSRYHSA